ncbi:MAG: lipocalin family protein [Fluviicola sp.]
MKIKHLILTGSLFALFVLPACNKYEDGPAVSLRTKKERVANIWQIENAYRNGENVTEDYDEFTLLLRKDGDAELAALYSAGDFTLEYETQGTWEFANDKENLSMDFENDDADRTYQILRLKEDELWLREIGGEDELHLMPR